MTPPPFETIDDLARQEGYLMAKERVWHELSDYFYAVATFCLIAVVSSFFLPFSLGILRPVMMGLIIFIGFQRWQLSSLRKGVARLRSELKGNSES